MATLRSKARSSAAASFALALSLRIVTAKGALLYGVLRGRLLGERHTEQSGDGQEGDHDPGFVDGLNERGLFDQRLHHRERRARERASRSVHEHLEGYADKLGGLD